MKERFRDKLHLNKKNILQLSIINEIIEEYANEGYKLTLRQLYYQLVSRGIIPNKASEYAKLSSLLVKGRMAGVVDWDAIEDRIRRPFLPYWVYDVEDAINDTINSYRLDRQAGQNVYIEIWIEKDALSGVLRKITSYYHINLMVNRGYSSCTAMHDAFKRFSMHPDKKCFIFYLGDYDPSGLDMIRDITDRLYEFGVDLTIKHLGITREQIDRYNPPPNPAKITDPRAKWYISRYGETSWEVDALSPKVLNSLLKKNIEKSIDMKLFTKQIKKEDRDKKYIKNLLEE